VLEIKGMIGDRPWTVTLPVAKAAQGAGLSKLWARRKITDVEMANRRDRSMAAEADKRILALALEHHLVSRLTSLVATDATPSRPEGARLTRAELVLNLPAGWDFDKVFGGERKLGDGPARSPVDPTPERRASNEAMPDLGTTLPAAPVPTAAPPLSSTTAPSPSRAQGQGVTLPRTATDSELKLIAGFLLMGLSLVLLGVRRRTA
jgi:Ca-activated chloride channel homolog